MADTFYKIVHLAGIFNRFQVLGLQNVTRYNPAIFAANHVGSAGPTSVVLSVPIRFYPWVIGEMTDPQRAPLYLYDDFIHPALHLDGRFGMLLAHMLAPISINLLKGLGGITVDRNRGGINEAFHQSLTRLEEGKNLLIFPEDNRQEPDPITGFRPFLGGFIWLTQMYLKSTGRTLPIYPMAVYLPKKTLVIGKEIQVDFCGERKKEIQRYTRLIREKVTEIYESLAGEPLKR